MEVVWIDNLRCFLDRVYTAAVRPIIYVDGIFGGQNEP